MSFKELAKRFEGSKRRKMWFRIKDESFVQEDLFLGRGPHMLNKSRIKDEYQRLIEVTQKDISFED